MLPADLIAFENAHPRPCPEKNDAIAREFGCSPTRYYQALFALMRSPEGVRLDPQLANRVRRRLERLAARRADRARARTA